MDGYPEHLAPPKDRWGGVDPEKFAEWWAQVKSEFPTVPENVAQYWLHEHWGCSPYDYIRSRDYNFELQKWPSRRLLEILSTWCRFDPEHADCLKKGEELLKKKMLDGGMYPTAFYMREEGNFPAPIIVLDNRDSHMSEEKVGRRRGVPTGLVLMEGHTRFNLGLYLLMIGRLKQEVDVWCMIKKVA